jgi:hypothetical protein
VTLTDKGNAPYAFPAKYGGGVDLGPKVAGNFGLAQGFAGIRLWAQFVVIGAADSCRYKRWARATWNYNGLPPQMKPKDGGYNSQGWAPDGDSKNDAWYFRNFRNISDWLDAPGFEDLSLKFLPADTRQLHKFECYDAGSEIPSVVMYYAITLKVNNQAQIASTGVNPTLPHTEQRSIP